MGYWGPVPVGNNDVQPVDPVSPERSQAGLTRVRRGPAALKAKNSEDKRKCHEPLSYLNSKPRRKTNSISAFVDILPRLRSWLASSKQKQPRDEQDCVKQKVIKL